MLDNRPDQTFGKWTVLHRVSSNKQAKYRCRCVCGNEKDVFGFSLYHGKSKSCGCGKIPPVPKTIDLTGQQIGNWHVLSLTSRNKRGMGKWLCRCVCGTERVVYYSSLRKSRSQSCGCQRVGSSHPSWKGGKTTDKHGYVKVRVGKRYIPEHRKVMEEHINRSLFPDETVHHKNGIRSDNNISNLEIRVRAKHPKGATTTELLEWAHEIIQRYQV